jgi:hypothetical protein
LPSSGQTLSRAFEALISILNERNVRYALIGGLAMLQHTRARLTDDIDILLELPQLAMAGLFEALRSRGFTVDIQTNIREFRDDGMTTIAFGGVLIDFLRAVIPTFSHVLDRAQVTEVLGRQARICSAEGLIVMKLAAMRPQDEADIRELIVAYPGGLDTEYILRELETFTEADDPRRARLEAWLRG